MKVHKVILLLCLGIFMTVLSVANPQSVSAACPVGKNCSPNPSTRTPIPPPPTSTLTATPVESPTKLSTPTPTESELPCMPAKICLGNPQCQGVPICPEPHLTATPTSQGGGLPNGGGSPTQALSFGSVPLGMLILVLLVGLLLIGGGFEVGRRWSYKYNIFGHSVNAGDSLSRESSGTSMHELGHNLDNDGDGLNDVWESSQSNGIDLNEDEDQPPFKPPPDSA